jgi:hypothetical protein
MHLFASARLARRIFGRLRRRAARSHFVRWLRGWRAFFAPPWRAQLAPRFGSWASSTLCQPLTLLRGAAASSWAASTSCVNNRGAALEDRRIEPLAHFSARKSSLDGDVYKQIDWHGSTMEGVTIIVPAIERGWHLALTLNVSTRMCRFLPLIFLPCGSMQAPLSRISRSGYR